MKTYKVEFSIIPFSYEVEAEDDEQAVEKAKDILFDDIQSNPNSIITQTFITEKKDGNL